MEHEIQVGDKWYFGFFILATGGLFFALFKYVS